jgi:hypothetical protein
MKRRDNRRTCSQPRVKHSQDARLHFPGGFVSEGDGEYLFRSYAARFDKVCNAVGDNARLARAGAGKNQKRAFGGLNGFELFWVKAFHFRLRIADCGLRIVKNELVQSSTAFQAS